MDAYRFLGHFDNVKECACNAQGDRQWSARCPAHADRVNSLHIALSGDGVINLEEGLIVIPVPDAVLVNHTGAPPYCVDCL